MQSKISCFNKTIYKKNLTRFAPVWGVYALCLALGMVLMYSNGGQLKQFHFAANYMTDLFYLMAVLNLGYALVVAQLLFGDLFNSRVCNMLHAFPVSRTSWFVTNVASGVTFSLVPTAVMALVSAPLLMSSLFEGAVSLAFWLFLAANLEFICFFGLAAFAAMCTANRFTMIAGYGLLNGGAAIAYWLVDTVYTPMLYGVITPTALMWNLTPIYHMYSFSFAKTEMSLWQLRDLYGDKLEGAALTFSLTDEWWRLWMVAAVGVAFLLLALMLYKRRQLECAGDAVAFPWLVPVFEVLCAVFVATAVQYSLEHILYIENVFWWVLLLSLVVGWFIAKMLVERSTRVFRWKNCTGLLILTVIFGISLGLTKLDVLKIVDSIPEAADIRTVKFGTDYTGYRILEDTSDIKAVLSLHEGALAERSEDRGTYILGYDGTWVKYVDTNDHLYDAQAEDAVYRQVTLVELSYELNNGKLIKRRYNVWVDSAAGEIANGLLNVWENLDPIQTDRNGVEYSHLEKVLADFDHFVIDYQDYNDLPEICYDKEAALELLECIRQDLAEGNMAQHPLFHEGGFRRYDERAEKGYYETESLGICIESEEDNGWYVSFYADSRHTVSWLQRHGVLPCEVTYDNVIRW